MSSQPISVPDLVRKWQQDPAFQAAYAELEEKFALAAALIAARSHAEMTQADVAAKMGTTQAVIARLEGGRARPTLRTLQRFADATGTRLRIRFEAPRPAK